MAMNRRRHKVLFGLWFVGLLFVIFFMVWWFVWRDTVDHRVRYIDGSSIASDFENSLLQLHGRGVFNVEIIFEEETTLFVGIGTFSRSRGRIEMTFIDAWTREMVGGQERMVRDGGTWIGQTHTFDINRHRIMFEFGGQIFYFGR